MNRFREINPTVAKKIDRTLMGMASLATMDELEKKFIEAAGAILPADCFCWNNWSLDLSHLMGGLMNPGGYLETFNSNLDAFTAFVGRHPVIASNHFAGSTERVMQMSEFESYRKFRENPLFREVYRHVDAHFQICYTPSILSDRRLLLTWNRRALDFSEQDRQVFEYMGNRLGVVSRGIDTRQQLESDWKALCGFVERNGPVEPVTELGTSDVALLTQLFKGNSRRSVALKLKVRRDSIDKRLGTIRERLGLENHHQLLKALAQLKTKSRSPVQAAT